MTTPPLRAWPLVLIAMLGAGLPILLLWWMVWRQPTLSPADVQRRLDADTVTLVDVRNDQDYARRHITGAVRLADAPENRAWVLVCDDGLQSAVVAAHLRAQGREVVVLADGVAGWIAAARHPDTIHTGLTDDGHAGPIPVRQESSAIQWLVVITGFVVKYLYMLMALVLAIRLRHAHSPGLTALRRGMWSFFLGEAFCALNYMAFDEDSVVTDHLHGVGMLLAVAFTAWAGWSGLRRHVLGDTGGRCLLVGWCAPCTRTSLCRVERFFPLAVGLTALTACVPLTLDPIPAWSSLTVILGTPYAYRHDMGQQLIEARWYPWLALVLSAWALCRWWHGHHRAAAVWLCAALGPATFALFRTVMLHAWHDDPAWFLAWEEFSEMATMVAVWCVVELGHLRHLDTPMKSAPS